MNSAKIQAQHLRRKAVIYLRQSSGRQVRENLESQRLQYGLADRARALGWTQVEIIDTDLGISASASGGRRPGFEQLVSQVALAEVGVIFSRELSRLSRNDKDWCQLLEVCQLFGTLIGDEEQLYDINLLDDQLVLGIKGTLSVVELKVLQSRMRQGLLAKARRGELFGRLAVGYVLGPDGQVVKDPDRRVQEAIALVFQKFRELWSVRQTFVWFHEQGVELPTQLIDGSGRVRIVWKAPSRPFLQHLLQNPFYAGAYVYGRQARQTVLEEGRLVRKTRRVHSLEQCQVFIREHHEGYIDWESFEHHQRMIRRNSNRSRSHEGHTSVRAGQALLSGLLRCGVCGRRLFVAYEGAAGSRPRYFCKAKSAPQGRCVSVGGVGLDQRVSEELLRVITTLGAAAGRRALERFACPDPERVAALRRQVEQLTYASQRAFEQYDQVDARNRLVAAELERRWNEKLDELEQTRHALSRAERPAPTLSAADQQRLEELAAHFERVWGHAECPIEIKKKILRTAIEEIIVTPMEHPDRLRIVIHWNGGVHTQFESAKAKLFLARPTSGEALDIIRRMAERYGDDQIAAVLNCLGQRTGKGNPWSQQRVGDVRRTHAIPGQSRGLPLEGVFNLSQAARHCAVRPDVIRRLVAIGVLPMTQIIAHAPWEIRQADLDAPAVRTALDHLRRTGRLPLGGGVTPNQQTLFAENQEVGNERQSN
jgi:DNA invertase Pin-like site-specific DNA recombinase